MTKSVPRAKPEIVRQHLQRKHTVGELTARHSNTGDVEIYQTKMESDHRRSVQWLRKNRTHILTRCNKVHYLLIKDAWHQIGANAFLYDVFEQALRKGAKGD